ncbi:nucleoside 2-deoxyribosyltransferase [Candidatus Saccharibacteria bacterium]|nr:nucleoside 2-deoxyribosyltransferase [Candidatus Saccharibacteria bacterium]
MNKIYFAGFDDCSPVAEMVRRKYRIVCAKYGYKAIFPSNPSSIKNSGGEPFTPLDESRAMFSENLRKIDSSNIVIANLGYSYELCTNNTAFEIGYAFSKHKRIIGYRDVDYIMKFHDAQRAVCRSANHQNRPPANFMTVCSMPVIIQGELEDCLDWLLQDHHEDRPDLSLD